MHRSKALALLSFLFLLFGFNSPEKPVTITSLRFINEYVVPFNKHFKETTVGGLSGIDYDPEHQLYYLISDDRSAIERARFYTAKISITEKGIDTVLFVDVQKILQPNGRVYPNAKEDAKNTPDPEAIRYNPLTSNLLWVSEGDRTVNAKQVLLNNPSIHVIDLEGNYKDSIPIAANLIMHQISKGPRKNGTLEALSYSSDFRKMFVCTEVPLQEDGPEADVKENNALTRFYQYDVLTKKNTAQYAYKLEPVAYPSHPETAFKVNGITDILYLDENKLLVIERSFSTGRLPCTVKIFLADLSKADNIISVNSLKETPPKHVVSKKLLLNMDDLGIYIDNIEGVTFGPDLPNGHRSLIFISDNNFAIFEKTQFLLFEVIP